jgi:hypothetical protein
MVEGNERVASTALFRPSASRPHLRVRDVATEEPHVGEVRVGIDPRSVTGELILVDSGGSSNYCLDVDERSSPASIKVDLIIATVD